MHDKSITISHKTDNYILNIIYPQIFTHRLDRLLIRFAVSGTFNKQARMLNKPYQIIMTKQSKQQ